MARRLAVGFIGLGEIGQILTLGLAQAGHSSISAYDPFVTDDVRKKAADAGITLQDSLANLCRGSDLIIGVAPGSQSLSIAEELQPFLDGRHVYLDMASTTPAIKQQVFGLLSPTGACIGDAVIVGSVSQGLSLSILACGPAAQRMVTELVPFGMSIREVPGPCGTAASIKIIRSVAVKGFGMLMLETLSAARHYGVEENVLASLEETFSRPLRTTVGRLVAGSLKHAVRRHEEVEMSARTLREAGIAPVMTEAAIVRFAELADVVRDNRNRKTIDRLEHESWQACIDWLQPRLSRPD